MDKHLDSSLDTDVSDIVEPSRRRKIKKKKGPFKGIKRFATVLLSGKDVRRIRKRGAGLSDPNDGRPDDDDGGDDGDDAMEIPGNSAEEDRAEAMRQWEHEKAKFNELFPKTKTRQPKAVKEKKRDGNKSELDLIKEIARDLETAVAEEIPPKVAAQPKPRFRIVTDAGKCNFCGLDCNGRSTPLPLHMSRHHRFRCETCWIEFEDQKALNRHRLIHRTLYRCDACEKNYWTYKLYEKHLTVRDIF